MKFTKHFLAAALVLTTMTAHATVTGSLGGGTGTFLTLSSAGLNGGSVATLSGGTIYGSDQSFADIPAGSVYGGNFLAAGPSSGANSATLNFVNGGLNFISFLWGSPDLYNVLTLTSSVTGVHTYTAAGMSFSQTNGNQGFSQYVQFSSTATDKITSLTFTNTPSVDAFEVANFNVTPVPEPETYALMLAGLGALGALQRRRNQKA